MLIKLLEQWLSPGIRPLLHNYLTMLISLSCLFASTIPSES